MVGGGSNYDMYMTFWRPVHANGRNSKSITYISTCNNLFIFGK